MYYIPQQILGSLWLVFISVGNVMSVGLAWYVWVAAVYVVGHSYGREHYRSFAAVIDYWEPTPYLFA